MIETEIGNSIQDCSRRSLASEFGSKTEADGVRFAKYEVSRHVRLTFGMEEDEGMRTD